MIVLDVLVESLRHILLSYGAGAPAMMHVLVVLVVLDFTFSRLSFDASGKDLLARRAPR